MDPQQFQNMGMARPMPNNAQQQINPAAAQMNAARLHGQQQMQRHIFTALQNQGPFSDWQAQVQLPERAQQIKLLIDSLRLVHPPVELPRAIEVAISFEAKSFSQSASKEEYSRECKEKLQRIRDQRALAVNQNAGMMPNMQMQNPNMQMQGQNFQQMQQMQQRAQAMNMNPQMQQQMQASPMPNQQQAGSQPQMTPKQVMSMQAGMMQQNNQRANQQADFSAEENKQINLRAYRWLRTPCQKQ